MCVHSLKLDLRVLRRIFFERPANELLFCIIFVANIVRFRILLPWQTVQHNHFYKKLVFMTSKSEIIILIANLTSLVLSKRLD